MRCCGNFIFSEEFFVKKLLLLLTLMLSILLLVGCQNANEYSNGGQQAGTLSALRTPYIGNASAVSRIIQVLPLPDENWLQRFFAMETNIAPYSLTVFYEPATLEALSTIQSQEKPTADFEANALLLFALIDNLSKVTFAVRYTPGPDDSSGGDYDYFWTISRYEIAELFDVHSWSELPDNNTYFEDLSATTNTSSFLILALSAPVSGRQTRCLWCNVKG